jgi:hypothetical protein
MLDLVSFIPFTNFSVIFNIYVITYVFVLINFFESLVQNLVGMVVGQESGL